MNREIKFRGKPALDEERIEELKQYMNEYYDGKFVYGNLIQDNWIVGEVVDSEEEWIALAYWIPVIPETVGQFTGLLSQDKQDIYEGDRVFDYDDDYYVVEFSEGRFVAVGDGFEVDLFEIADRCSIISNIHDNPELLGVQNA